MKELKSSVHKTFAILEYFSIQKPEWGVTELADTIGSNKSTVYRFLSDLSKLGVTVQTSTRVINIADDVVSVRRGDLEEEIAAKTILWAAGVKASSLGEILAKHTGVTLDRA